MSLRKLARVAVGVAALLPFATCTDFTGPSGRRAVRVPIVPTFSEAATLAKAMYAAAGLEFDRVRVLIVRDESTVLKDTTVAFSPSSPELTLPLVVTAQPGEIVKATLEYRLADIILYSGTALVTTQSVGTPSTAEPTPVVIIPVGPGSDAASVEISPASGTFPVSAPVSFTATAFTSDHTEIAGALFGWTVDDPTIATVDAQGVVQPTTKGGAAKVRATTLNDKFAEATVTFVAAAASVTLQSGGSQTAMALDPLPSPVIVKVRDASGGGIAGVPVSFAVVTGGGSVTALNEVTDASGHASANWTLGATVGTQSITATAATLPNAPLTITATATARTVGAPHTWVGSVSTNWHDAANWNPASVPTASDSVTIPTATNQPLISDSASAKAIVIQSGGILRINSPTIPLVTVPKILILGTMELTYGYISGDIDNRGSFFVYGFGIANSLTATSTALTRIAGPSADDAAFLNLVHGFTNDGTFELTDINGGAAELLVTDSLVNHAGGTINVKQTVGGERVISGVLRNYGAINVQSTFGLYLQQTATGNVNAGSMTFTNGGPFYLLSGDGATTFDNTGTIALGASDWTIQFGSIRVRTPGAVTGTGLLTTFQTNLDVDFTKLPLRMTIDEFTRFAGDSVTIPSGVTATFENSSFAQKVVVLGTLKGTDAFFGQTQFMGDLTIKTGGAVEISNDGLVSGALTISPSSMLKLIAGGRNIGFHSDNSFTNSGLIELTSSGGTFAAALAVDGTLFNAAGGQLRAVTSGESRIDAQLDNKGSIIVAGTAYLTLPKDGAAHVNSGTISLADAVPGPAAGPANLLSLAMQTGTTSSSVTNTGTIDIGANRTLYIGENRNLINSGTITGTGTFEIDPDGAFTNTGIFAPGGVGKVGTMLFKGSFDVGSGSVDIDVASMSSADLLQVTGTAAVNGRINVNALPGFVNSGESLQIITGSPCLGTPVIEPANGWGGYNDGCFFIFAIVGGPPARPPI